MMNAGDRHAAGAGCSALCGFDISPTPILIFLPIFPISAGSFPSSAIDVEPGIDRLAQSKNRELSVAWIGTLRWADIEKSIGPATRIQLPTD